MLLQFAIVLISLHMGTAQRVVAVSQEGLREEFRRQVREVIEQTTTNVSRFHQMQCGIEGAVLRDEISEQTNTTLELIAESNREHESTAEELKECIRDLDAGLRKGVETTVTQAVDTAVSTAVETAVQTTVAQVVDRAVTTAVDRAVTEAVNSLVTEIVNRVVTEAVEKAVTEAVDKAVNIAVDRAVNTTIDPIEQLLQSLLNDVALLRLPGTASHNPATSCKGIKTATASPSGYYWLRGGNGSSIRVYCDMTRTCGGITGGWMQVANLDMTNSSHTCPQGLNTLTSPKRLCVRNVSGRGCSAATFATHGTKYTHICGKVIAYQYGQATAFVDYYHHRSRTIDSITVSGATLTHGSNPRKHIWTFATALDEATSSFEQSCPCSNPASTAVIPPWVGNDYFCDSGAEQRYQYIFYPDDPLWDGEGCGVTSTCCSFNNPPWFSKQLPSPTTDDIEMRLCRYHHRFFEDTRVEKIELYVQ